MSGTDNGPKGPDRRWWEIRGGREPGEGRYSDLVTGGRGRSRPERSLSIGADPVEQSRHRWHGFLWPVVSVVAVGVLIGGGMYAVPRLTSESAASDTTSRAEAEPGGAGDGSSTPQVPLSDLPGASGLQPLGPGDIPGGSSGDSDGSAEGSDGDQGSEPSEAPTSGSASAPVPFVEVDRPAPNAPESEQEGSPVSGWGCTPLDTGGYACFVVQDAPVYRPGASSPTARLAAGRYRFLCQSEGAEYSTENRTNQWWAWAGNGSAGVWVPVVFLQGSKDDAPQPGLPVCGDEPTSTTTSTPTPTSEPPASPQSSAPSEPSASSGTNPN